MTTTITTSTELQNMNLDLAEDYLLGNDIDMDGVNWTPVGTSGTPFTGTFNGQGNTISNMTLVASSGNDNFGLWGYVQDVTIENFTMDNCTLSATVDSSSLASIGFVAGRCEGSGSTLTNSFLNITLSNLDVNIVNDTDAFDISNIGTLAGRCEWATVGTCTASGDLQYDHVESTLSTSSVSQCGGLIGYAFDRVSVTASSAAVNMVMNGAEIEDHLFTNVGGFIGTAIGDDTYLANCSSTGTLYFERGDSDDVGGFCGFFSGLRAVVDNCFATGTLDFVTFTNSSCIGGFISTVSGQAADTTTIKNSYCTGNITFTGTSSSDSMGGFAANLLSVDVDNCYSTSNMVVALTADGTTFGGFVGNLTAQRDRKLTNSYCTGALTMSDRFIWEVGGFCGEAFLGSSSLFYNVEDCYCTGTVRVTATQGDAEWVGGFFGELNVNDGSDVTRNYTTSEIIVSSADQGAKYVGGFIGQLATFSEDSLIYDNYARGDITISVTGASPVRLSHVGGFVGEATYGLLGTNYIRNSYTSSAITITTTNTPTNYNYIGGFAGYISIRDDGWLQNVFSVGLVTFSAGASMVGGFIGELRPNNFNNSGNINNCAWYTSEFGIAVGNYRDYTATGVYTEVDVPLLATKGWGTDEPDNKKFQRTTNHVVFAQGT